MRVFFVILVMILLTIPVVAEQSLSRVKGDEEDIALDFDAQRRKLREDYLKTKAAIEQDYTDRLKALDAVSTDELHQIEKKNLDQEYRDRKQSVLDGYQEQVRKIRREEAAFEGKLNRSGGKEKASGNEAIRRSSRSIPPFEGQSALGTNPKIKKGRSSGLIKSGNRAKQPKRNKRSQLKGSN